MTISEAQEIVRVKNEKRYPHVYSTYLKAKYLASKHQVSEDKCSLGAILHDYAKNTPINEMKNIINNYLDKDLLKFDEETYHGFVGAYLVETVLGVTDKEILDSIMYHVTGTPLMSDVAKVVYVADFIEDRRTHPGVELCRKLSDISLDLGVLGCAERTLQFLYERNNRNIHPLTLSTYEFYLKKVGKDNYDIIKNHCESM